MPDGSRSLIHARAVRHASVCGSMCSMWPQPGSSTYVQAGASGLHTAGVWALTQYLRLPYPISKLVVVAAVFLGWNYPLNRWFVFHRRT